MWLLCVTCLSEMCLPQSATCITTSVHAAILLSVIEDVLKEPALLCFAAVALPLQAAPEPKPLPLHVQVAAREVMTGEQEWGCL